MEVCEADGEGLARYIADEAMTNLVTTAEYAGLHLSIYCNVQNGGHEGIFQ